MRIIFSTVQSYALSVANSPKIGLRPSNLTLFLTTCCHFLLHFCRNRTSHHDVLSWKDRHYNPVSKIYKINKINYQFYQLADWHARIYLNKIIIYLYIKIFCNKTRPPLKLIVPQTQPKLIKLIIDFVEKVDFFVPVCKKVGCLFRPLPKKSLR